MQYKAIRLIKWLGLGILAAWFAIPQGGPGGYIVGKYYLGLEGGYLKAAVVCGIAWSYIWPIVVAYLVKKFGPRIMRLLAQIRWSHWALSPVVVIAGIVLIFVFLITTIFLAYIMRPKGGRDASSRLI